MNIPAATYRIQFSSAFKFGDALPIIDYLTALGVSHLYASPMFTAKPGSTHGYDVVDPTTVNPDLGGETDFRTIAIAARQKGLQWLQDIVPNHMAYDSGNRVIMDVLENGPCSPYRDFLDVNWEHSDHSIRGKLLAPFLGKYFGDALESGEIRLVYNEQGIFVTYYNLRFPLRIGSYVKIFSYDISKLKKELGEENEDFVKFVGALYSLKNIPQNNKCQELHPHMEITKNLLWQLYAANPTIHHFIDHNLEVFNGTPGEPASYQLLEQLLSEQLFRLSFWKVASEELNYRRFFSINDLISLKVEREEVYRYVHRLILLLIEENLVQALRVDHIDGLYDPLSYLKKLRSQIGERYLAVEKILQSGESLPDSWPVQGTTGYDFLNEVNGLFINKAHENRFDQIYYRFLRYRLYYDNIVVDEKRLIIGKYMAGDVEELAQLMKRISSRDRKGIDITLFGLKRALVDVLALFPVYRTYVNADVYSETDCAIMKEVIRKAKEINPGLLNELSFIGKFLLLEDREYRLEEERKQRLHFVMRFQQYTGPLMAKGFEDTALYVYNRFISLNEVGGNPGKFGVAPPEFHAFNQARALSWPHTMNATATHDTKRGEDFRARLNVISEFPGEWRAVVRNWGRVNEKAKRILRGKEVPAKNDEYFLYQTLVGAFPFYERDYPRFIERIKEYMIKAVREAKIYTAWLKPDDEYENGFLSFVDAILLPTPDNEFLQSFLPFQKKIAYYGTYNSLSQTLLKVTAPGVPDIYQGTELWDFSLVDPDNRRPVDFEMRRRLLDEIRSRERTDLFGLLRDLLSSRENGTIKMYTLYRALTSRKDMPELFSGGTYLPIEVRGKFKDSIVAFARRFKDRWAITVVPRFLSGVVREFEYPLWKPQAWGDTHCVMPAGAPAEWFETLTQQTFRIGPDFYVDDILQNYPAAFLLSKSL